MPHTARIQRLPEPVARAASRSARENHEGVDAIHVVEGIAFAFEVVGIAIITIGGVIGIARAAFSAKSHDSFYESARDGFARPLLLGLEVLVAADIIETITIDRSLESAASLGIVVLIRVILSFSLEAETDGMWPWRKAALREHAAADAGHRGGQDGT